MYDCVVSGHKNVFVSVPLHSGSRLANSSGDIREQSSVIFNILPKFFS